MMYKEQMSLATLDGEKDKFTKISEIFLKHTEAFLFSVLRGDETVGPTAYIVKQ